MIILWGIKQEHLQEDDPALYERPLLSNAGNLSVLETVLPMAALEGWGSFRRSDDRHGITHLPTPAGLEIFDWRK